MGGIQTGCIQGGTHEETPHPGSLVMDRTAGFLAEAGVDSSVVEVEVIVVEEAELVNGEAQFPRDVGPVDGGFSVLWGFRLFSSSGVRHGAVFKYRSEWAHL